MRPGTVLQGDLARHLQECGFLTFTEIEIRGTEAGGYAGRVDVAAIKPHHYARRDLRAYECKASRQDFFRDVDTEKWRRYQDVFPRVYFAVPSGLVTRAEVPDDAGLIVRGDNGWSTIKAAHHNHTPSKLNADSVLALLFRGYEQHREIRNLRDRLVYSDRGVVEEARAFGWDVRHKLAQKAPELDRPLRELKEALETLTGEPVNGLSIERLTQRLQIALTIAEEAEKHGGALRHIASYLQSLTSSYSSKETRDRTRQAVGTQMTMPLVKQLEEAMKE